MQYCLTQILNRIYLPIGAMPIIQGGSFKDAISSDNHTHMHNSALNSIGTISYNSESEGEKDHGNETLDILSKLDGLAQDLDDGITGVSTVVGSKRPVTHKSPLFLEDTPAAHNKAHSRAQLTLSIPSQVHDVSSDEPTVPTVRDRIGAMLSPTAAGGAGPISSPGLANLFRRVSQRSNKGVKNRDTSVLKD